MQLTVVARNHLTFVRRRGYKSVRINLIYAGDCMKTLIILSGIFTFALGAIHVFLPIILKYKKVMFNSIYEPSKLNFMFSDYKLKISDLYGIIWVMNNHASFVLLSIGALDIFLVDWLLGDGEWVCLWISTWWILRVINQLFIGYRIGDICIMIFFFVLAVIHFGGYYL